MAPKLDYSSPYKKGGKIFAIPPYRQTGAGPTNMDADVAAAMLFQPVTAFNPYCKKLIEDLHKMVQYVFQTKSRFCLVAQMTGNGGNEACVTNLADPGETVIVAIAGIWGQKVVDMAQRYGLNTISLEKDPGEVYSFEELEEAIVKHQPVALFVTQGESTGGTLQPLDGLGDICHKYNCLLVVDAVVSMGVVPLFVDRWKIDAVSGASQKGLGAPAGLCPMAFSDLAHQKMLSKKHRPPYILDMLALGRVWNCFEGESSQYHYTYGTPMLAALRQSLAKVCDEGLDNVWERHKYASDLFVSKLPGLRMRHFVEKPENRFTGVSCVTCPEGVQWPKLFDYLLKEHELEVSFGIGPTGGNDLRNLRIGFLGPNAQPDIVERFVTVLEDGIKYCLTV